MAEIVVERFVRAAPERVFRAVTDLPRRPDVVEAIDRVEFFDDQHVGVGTRFRETRRVRGREVHLEQELVALYEPERVARFRSESEGSTWEITLRVFREPEGSKVRVELVASPTTWLSTLSHVVPTGWLRRRAEARVEEIRAWCEGPASP